MGTKFIPDYISFVETQIDTNNDMTSIEEADLELVLGAAIKKYSQDNPQVIVTQITGDGGFRYALPTDWDHSFSHIMMIETPIGERVPRFIRKKAWKIHDIGDGDGKRIHFKEITPTAAETFAVHFTALHSLTDAASTIDDADFESVCYLFAHYVCITLSGRLRRTKDASFGADIIDPRRTKADEYLTQARAYFQLYRTSMGLPEKGPKAADIVGDTDMPTPWSPIGYLTHQVSR